MAVLKYLDVSEEGKREWKEFYTASDGITFIPQVDKDGILSWDNNGHLPNPDPVDLTVESVITRNTKAEFPTKGKESSLYIEKSTGSMYRWDETFSTYISIGGGGGSGTICIVMKDKITDFPTEGQDGVVYIEKENGIFYRYDVVEKKYISLTMPSVTDGILVKYHLPSTEPEGSDPSNP